MAQKMDPTWAYGIAMGSKTKIKCVFCDITYNGGIFRHKKHLIGGYKDVKVCSKVPNSVKEEIKEYFTEKNEFKTQMNPEASMVNLVDDDEMDDEVEVNMPMGPPSKTKKKPSTSESGSSTASNVKGPLNFYFSQKPNEKRKGGPIDLEASSKILQDRAVSAFARWMYDAGLPFNCVYTENFGEFIEAVGQYGPGMKPPTYHEVRVPCLKKEVEKTNKIVEDHKVQWKTYGCSIMMDKWTTRNGKMIINVLVNSPKGSVILESHDASDSSTDSNKMFNLFEKTILKIGKENVVQVVTDNASENKKRVTCGRECSRIFSGLLVLLTVST
ncbi:uncharacterized protein LOC129882601 [Solanum dulcamara]|uniref:uncharacterized protein LOC129882601 n=1 Tax=Solanum dulcamara TaxID=45834 RepID=UPI002486B55F|nr:uncharacterized protein LOC129882601 [Solanum dulcamara]